MNYMPKKDKYKQVDILEEIGVKKNYSLF